MFGHPRAQEADVASRRQDVPHSLMVVESRGRRSERVLEGV
jgi:hypothetical protein